METLSYIRVPKKNYKNWILVTCKYCKKQFEVPPCYSKKLYCSKKCFGMDNRGKPLTPNHIEGIRNAMTGVPKSERHKERTRDAVINHYLKTGKYCSVIKPMVPKRMFLRMIDPDYGKREETRTHRNRMRDVKECQICGFSLTKLLEVHHKNGRKDNSSLAKICPNCHFFIHRYGYTYKEAEDKIKLLQERGLWFRVSQKNP